MLSDNNATMAYVLSVIFLLMWTGTEIYEASERAKKWAQIEAFIHRGDRFTAAQGEELKKRICRLEKREDIDCQEQQ